MKVTKVKDDPTKKANLAVRVDGFRVAISGGNYSGPKGNLVFRGIEFNAVPTRSAREIAIFLCKDGRLYQGERVSGRPATLPSAPLIDKLLWFTIEPDAKNLVKAAMFVKDFIDIKLSKGPEPLKEGKAPPPTKPEDEALYEEDALNAMNDETLQDLAAEHGSKLKKRAKVIDYLLSLTQADAIPEEPPEMMYDPDELADLDDETLEATMQEHDQEFTDREAALAYLCKLTSDGELLDD